MHLADYIEWRQKDDPNFTIAEMAQAIQIDNSTLSRLVSGKRTLPRQELAHKIYEFTGGLVCGNDFYGFGPVRQPKEKATNGEGKGKRNRPQQQEGQRRQAR